MTSQRAREAVFQFYKIEGDEVPSWVTTDQRHLKDAVMELIAIIAALETEALERGARAMQEAALEKMDECCEPCLQCHQNVTALSSTDVTKGLSDDENQ